ncbi:2,3-diaminopropionate biosynthesis protein SbnA [Corallococcus sp. CA053C]|uniref:2,3-diaminopropionate biosynthesis protein SbnA n=1 Tax=Corallococcus sp. CA053C TaxID=2316732 RepID=UPI000EA35F54|nr:2,3-diaminopropionate biosynthesis protein SbnA [Corallococcus sp. CA053C]RKH05134.1 2,3-diaminopropionate biosynthesis protein SbnA [Corallococcus sp. CA053C]
MEINQSLRGDFPDLRSRIRALQACLRETPVVPLSVEGIDLFAKLEFCNPFGSVKDRAAFWILKSAIESGLVTEKSTIIESSSGNFASAMASYCQLLALPFIAVIDPNIAATNEAFLRRTCSQVVKVEERDDVGGYLKTRLRKVQDLCANIPHSFWPNQYGNLRAVEAHYTLTGGEICQRFSELDYVFIGVSTGGTIAGISRRVKEHFPAVKVIAVDAEGSVIFGGPPKRRYIPGLGASMQPELVKHAQIDDVVLVPEHETVSACQELLFRHGLFVGGSSGTCFAAVKRSLPKLRGTRPPQVLFLCADRGSAYLDTVFNAEWSKQLAPPDVVAMNAKENAA